MKTVSGNTNGLKASQIHLIENLFRRKIPVQYPVSPEVALELIRLTQDIHRQIGILINRAGHITHVIVGDPQRIVIPDTTEYRAAPGRLMGLRCVHTHLAPGSLTREDLTDLALLRLDLMALVTPTSDGRVESIQIAHILPNAPEDRPYRILPPQSPGHLDIGCLDMIAALEAEMAQLPVLRRADPGLEQALLVSVTSEPRSKALDSLDELKELCRSVGISVAGRELQLRARVDSRTLMGRGKLHELAITALHKAVSLLIFDQELNASQIRSITDQINLKVIDRTQLILDIFAQRAKSREGKLQVELAQLKYLLPRLVTKNTAMSRLTGGIGGRGPGETKLEVNRRRARERIHRLEKALEQLRKQRRQQRSRRSKKGLPVISIIGYTNAGKSTLLNTLTHSRVLAENRLFATLDPSSRRLRFPRDLEVIVTDTVGFIKDLPKDLVVAFRATLEELENADLLLHVIDVSNPRHQEQIESVERILTELGLDDRPMIRVLNKQDRIPAKQRQYLVNRGEGVLVSATEARSLVPLIDCLQQTIGALRAAFPASEPDEASHTR